MKQFIEHVQKSIYNPTYYQELLTRPLSFSWKYYSALALTIAIFSTIVYSIPLVPLVGKAVHEFPTKFFAYYPDELELRVNKGVVSSNVVEPYFLPAPPFFKEENVLKEAEKSLVVIDTQNPFSLEQFESYNAVAWVGKNQIAFHDEDGSVRIKQFNEGMSFVLDEEVLRTLSRQMDPFYQFVAPTVVLAIFFGLLVALGMNFIYLIFGAVLIFFLGRLMKQEWSYGTSYRIGLHAMTIPLLITTLLSLLHLPAFDFPFSYSAIMLGMVYANFKDLPPTLPEASMTSH